MTENRARRVSGLHVLTDYRAVQNAPIPRPLVKSIGMALDGGAPVVQLRYKEGTTAERIALGRELLPLTRSHGALLIVNDDVEAALALGIADGAEDIGLHVGLQDTPVDEVRRRIGKEPIVGLTVNTLHDIAQAQALENLVDYYGLLVDSSQNTKPDSGPGVGIRGVEIASERLNRPIVVIGNRDKTNITPALRAGARGVGCVGAVLRQADPRIAAATIVDLINPPEQVPLLDHNGVLRQIDDIFVRRSIARKEAEANHGNIPVARVFLFRETEFGVEVLLQRRADYKKLWGGRWDASIVETSSMNPANPYEPETAIDTAKRGLTEELNVTEIAFADQSFQDTWEGKEYPMKSFITTYTARYDGEFILDKEVADIRWIPTGELIKMVELNPEQFTPSLCKFVLKHREDVFK